MIKLGMIAATATALVGTELVAADVEWKWDESQHSDTPPASVVVSVASAVPNTTSKVNVGQLSTWVYRWLDSAGFGFRARKTGLFLSIR